MALSLTLIGTTLRQSTFDAIAPDGNPLHFRDRAATYVDPITQVDTGLQVHVVIANLFAAHGDPLTGLFLSTVGDQLAPHMAVHTDDFPNQTGAPGQRADKLGAELVKAAEFLYKKSIIDPDTGQPVEIREFWPAIHVWNYPALIPRGAPGVGDYLLRASTSSPPGNWWQGL